jgi:hypothetical protein
VHFERFGWATAVAVAMTATLATAGQTTRYVDDDTCPLPGSGTAMNPFCSIQAAITISANGDEIVVAPGTYNEAIDLFGKAVHLHSEAGAAVTIIDGTGLGTSVVTCATGEGPDTVLEGFTITGGTGTFEATFDMYLGGGMHVYQSGPTVRGCVFTDNTTLAGPNGSAGGGMNNWQATTHVVDCKFTLNTAQYAGGLNNYESDVTVENCLFDGNEAVPQDGTGVARGGGMHNAAGSNVTVTGCIFRNNSAEIGGGLRNNLESATTVNNCLFAGNTASVGGGGVQSSSSTLTVNNSTFIGNSSPPQSGAAIRNTVGTNATVSNSILFNPDLEILSIGGSTVTVRYSDIEGGYPGAGNIDADPMCDADGRPQAGSPCIDAGDNWVVPPGTTEDLGGNARFVDDPDTDDTGLGDPPIVDMGAFEFQPCVADLDGSGDVGFNDLLTILVAWGPCPGCPADLNGDDTVGFEDLLIVLTAWGPCA